jgi:hypothetical protein
MRTLNRPMFNMGGPIKQGIMHGIREPKRHGGPTGTGLVGDQRYPKTGGREHHAFFVPAALAAPAAWTAARAAGMRLAPRIFRSVGNIFRGTGAGQVTGGGGLRTAGEYAKTRMAPLTNLEKMKSWFQTAPAGKYLAGSPEAAAAQKVIAGRGLLGKPLKWAAKSPLTVGAGAIYGVPWAGKKLFGGDDAIDAPTPGTGVPGGGDPGMTYTPPEKEIKVLSDDERKAFAKSQRDARVQKYLQMMGYDTAKKTAIADALIDASKIVSDRGTLDRKNITGELINPIIQATSKRLDKPGQIREAVGLMMTKAGLEKEMYDAKPGTIAKNVQDMVKSGKYTEEEAWAISTKGSQGAVADIQGAIATGKVGAGDWPAFVRSTGAQHGENVEVITDEQIKERYKDQDKIPNAMEIIAAEGITDDGIYVIGSETVRIKDGKPTQLR